MSSWAGRRTRTGFSAREPIDLLEVFRKYGSAILRRCALLLRDQAEAEDAAQEVMLTLMQKSSQFRGEVGRDDHAVWVHRVTTHVCLNRLRKARRREGREAGGEVAAWLAVPMATPFERVSSRLALQQVLGSLDDLAQQVFVHVFLDGLSHEECAQAVGVSRKTVEKRLKQIEATLARTEEET